MYISVSNSVAVSINIPLSSYFHICLPLLLIFLLFQILNIC
jgi:hypothetical protein